MLGAISLAVRDSRTIEELERRGIKASFDYFVEFPAMYRIIIEAQISAPAAFRQFVSGMRSAYVRSLRRSRDLGDLANSSDGEIATISAVLMGARIYLSLLLREADEDQTDHRI